MKTRAESYFTVHTESKYKSTRRAQISAKANLLRFRNPDMDSGSW